MSPQGSTCPIGNEGSVVDDGQRAVQGHQGSVDECDDGAAPAPSPVVGMWAWFKADAGVTKDAQDHVGAYGDQSGNARNCTQAAIEGPIWLANQFNGLPAIRYNSNGLENLVDNIPLGARSLYVVAQADGAEGGSLLTFRRSANDWTMYPWLFGGTQYLWSDGVFNIAAITPVNYSAAPHVFAFFQSASNVLTVKVDGVLIAKTSSTTFNETGSAGFTLGGRALGSYLQGWDGRIAEHLMYDADQLDSPDETQNMTYLVSRYAL